MLVMIFVMIASSAQLLSEERGDMRVKSPAFFLWAMKTCTFVIL